MLLQAVIVPPRAVLDAVALVVQSVNGVAAAAPSQPARGGFLRRRGNPAAPPAPAADAADAADQELDLIPTERMLLPIAGFGNVTREDAVMLADALQAAAATW